MSGWVPWVAFGAYPAVFLLDVLLNKRAGRRAARARDSLDWQSEREQARQTRRG